MSLPPCNGPSGKPPGWDDHAGTWPDPSKKPPRWKDLDDQGFANLLAYVINETGATDEYIANSLHVSRPTVSRWRRGKNLPHKKLRPRVARWIWAELLGIQPK